MRLSTALVTVLVLGCPGVLLAQDEAPGAQPAQEAAPPPAEMDPPPDEDAGNPELKLAPPQHGNPPQVPLPGATALHAEDAAQVARDAALGGWGVLGPFGLLGFVQFVAPLVGATAAGWASQQQGEGWTGQWVRGLASAVTELLVVGVLSLPIVGVLLAAAVGLTVVGVVSALLIPWWAGTTYGFSSPQFLAAPTIAGGLSLVLSGMVYLAMPVAVALWASLAAWVGTKASSLVWDRVWATPEKRDGLGGTRIPGQPPLERLPAAGLVAAAYAGAEDRDRWVEMLPLLGPWLVLAYSTEDVAERAHQARRVAGWEDGPDVSGVARTFLAVRAFLQSGGMLLNLVLAGVMVALGAGLAGAGLWMAVSNNVGLATGLGILATVGSLLLSSVLGIGGGMLLLANVARVFTPWGVATRAMWDATQDADPSAEDSERVTPAPDEPEGTTAKDN
jgi:hypothetical protein